MNLNEFINKYNGKFVDYDKKFGNQCVDLMRQYIKEVWGLNPYTAFPANKYAKYMFNYYSVSLLKKTVNTPTGVPKPGDIIFWKTYPFVTGVAGHVGIVVSANVNSLIIFNQNYPINSACSMRKFSYKGVLGWFSKK